MSEPPHPGSADRLEGGDYEVVRLSIGWGSVSILAFATILTLQMFGFRVFGLDLSQVVVATLPLALSGFACGLIGLRFGRGRGAAKVGTFLNGIVLLCIFVLLPLTYQVTKWLRM